VAKFSGMLFFLLLCLVGFIPSQASAGDAPTPVEATLHILDYVAVDYPVSVQDGKVINSVEYAEQAEFVEQARAQIAALPTRPEQADLQQRASELVAMVRDRKPGGEVSALAALISREIIKAYNVATAPSKAPDLRVASTLFRENCAACHGVTGLGDGPQAAALQPRPSNLHDRSRSDQQSVFSLYNSITLGVPGTAMPSFSSLKDNERWALAFFAATLAASDAEKARGEALWRGKADKVDFADLQQISNRTPLDVEKKYGADGRSQLAYLRSNPGVLEDAGESPLAFSARTLTESLAAYESGDRTQAQQLAVNAYLEGYELVEGTLDNVDRKLRLGVEKEMLAYRNMLKAGAPVDSLRAEVKNLKAMLAEVDAKLESSKDSAGTNFLSAFLILLREGVEAILILGGITAFLIKTGRRDGLRYVHLGWIAALLLGGVTWLLASRFITISGANRELTEGITAIVSAVVLLYVGYWLHGKVYAERWKEYIETKLKGALSGGTFYALAFLSFFTVYREVFETVLFYQALWAQVGSGGQSAIVYGFAAAVLALAALAWLVFYFSVRLPLRLFFGASSVLIAVLAIIFTGKGIAALQGAGKLPVNPIDIAAWPALGIYPNLEGLGLQALLLLAIVGGYFYTHHRAHQVA
jgi:high-affinity iron transporter